MKVEEKVITLIKNKQDLLDKELSENSRIFAEGLLKNEKPDCLKDMMASLNKVASSARSIDSLNSKISLLKELEFEINEEFKKDTITSLAQA